MKILKTKGEFFSLTSDYKRNEWAIQELLDKINEYRIKPTIGESLVTHSTPH
jgi:hypothetical protein